MPKRTSKQEAELWAEIMVILDKARAEEEAQNERPKEEEQSDHEPKTVTAKVLRALKLFMPHLGLLLALMTYLTVGALLFIWIESEHEMNGRKQKLDNVTGLRTEVIKHTVKMCQKRNGQASEQKDKHRKQLEAVLLPLLHSISWAHEYQDRYAPHEQMWTTDKDNMRELWTFPTSMFYTLTVATSTGYERVSPRTPAGQLFTVGFGLIGIPMLFITAADIGKFMSEMVTKTYVGSVKQYRKLKQKHLEKKRKKENRHSQLLMHCAKQQGYWWAAQSQNGFIQAPKLPTSFQALQQNLDDDEEIQMPFLAYFSLILIYCAFGSFILNWMEKGKMWNFIYGFFFGFNAITTIGVGDIDGRNLWYMSMIVAYVIIGLAVITMVIDLASSQVKVLFQKLHYFGRQIRGAKLALSGEIQEALQMIAAMKYKNDVTLDDIITFLTVQERLNNRPYIPRNVYFLKWIEEEYSLGRADSIRGPLSMTQSPNHLADRRRSSRGSGLSRGGAIGVMDEPLMDTILENEEEELLDAEDDDEQDSSDAPPPPPCPPPPPMVTVNAPFEFM